MQTLENKGFLTRVVELGLVFPNLATATTPIRYRNADGKQNEKLADRAPHRGQIRFLVVKWCGASPVQIHKLIPVAIQ